MTDTPDAPVCRRCLAWKRRGTLADGHGYGDCYQHRTRTHAEHGCDEFQAGVIVVTREEARHRG